MGKRSFGHVDEPFPHLSVRLTSEIDMKTKLLDDNARRSIAQSKRRPAKITLATVGKPFEPVRLESMLRASSPTPSRVGEAGRPGVPSAAK